ncbi:MAG: DUF4249 domain-containing protein [Saprospiraceae bacterium]
MKNTLHIFILLNLFLLVTTCEKEVQLNIEEVDSKLAILCDFSPDEPFVLELSKSKSINSTKLGNNIINNADIQICVNNEVIETILPLNTSSDANSKYQSIVALPKIKQVYTLKVEVDGLEPITATSSIPEAIEISHSSIGEINSFLTDDNETINYDVRVAVQLEDPADETNYYQVSFYQEILTSKPTAQQNEILIVQNDGYSLIDNDLTNNFNLIDGGVLFKDFTFNGTTKEFVFEPSFYYKPEDLNTNTTSTPINIIIELRSVSEEYYKYYTSVYRQSSQDKNTPFSNPTVIYSNIKNGYGVFAGYSKSTVKTPIEL